MKKIFIIALFLLGMWARTINYKERFYYGHDNDLASWIVKDIIFDHHQRLIGQLTSSPGIYIGSLFYYLIIPGYWISQWDPVGSLSFSWAVGAISLFSIYYCLAKVHGKKVGLIALSIYALSFSIVSTEREVVPTTPVFLWSIWFYYASQLWFKGKAKGFYIGAFLLGLVWHIHLVLGIVGIILVVGLAYAKNWKKYDALFKGLLVGGISLSPFIVFELHHRFIQIRALLFSFEGKERVSRTFVEKFLHVLSYEAKNINEIVWSRPDYINIFVLPAILVSLFLLICIKKQINKQTQIITFMWIVLFTGFFIFHPINLSEYYLNSLNILWITGASLVGVWVWKSGLVGKILLIGALVLFGYHNIDRSLNTNINKSGYVERKEIIEEIFNDAQKRDIPCISLSYMTDPGYELGYRYLVWRQGLKTAKISEHVPVYTIVFPHPRANKLDKTFGALGLIYPEYSKYNQKDIIKHCSNEDENITGSMFGFTK